MRWMWWFEALLLVLISSGNIRLGPAGANSYPRWFGCERPHNASSTLHTGHIALVAEILDPSGVASGSWGLVFIASTGLNSISVYNVSTGSVNGTIGSGEYGYEDGSAEDAKFRAPRGLALNEGVSPPVLYVADSENQLIRVVTLDPSGYTVGTLAGKYHNDQIGGLRDGPPLEALFFLPYDISFRDGVGLAVADYSNHAVRWLDPVDFNVTTIAGNASRVGHRDGNSSVSRLTFPLSVSITYPIIEGVNNNSHYLQFVHNSSVVYIATGHCIKAAILKPPYNLTTVAGHCDEEGFSDGNGSESRFYAPEGLRVDIWGDLYVADTVNNRLRIITPQRTFFCDEIGHKVRTLLGNTTAGTALGAPVNVRLNAPTLIDVFESAALHRQMFIVDRGNNRVVASTAICLNACQNNSTCNRTNYCECVPGWTDIDCSLGICTSPNCQSFEECAAPEFCDCPLGYNGSLCDVAICPDGCYNNGTCVEPGRCGCVDGWGGHDCLTPSCDAYPCENGGTCVAPLTCACTAQWYNSSNCTEPVCNDPCQNGGTCVLPDTCQCTSQYESATCLQAICNPECVHGYCISPDVCQCDTGWNGTACDVALCNPECQHGNCTWPDKCTCETGWNGTACEIAICDPECQNNQTCTAPDFCNCSSLWTGDQCETPTCTPACSIGEECYAPNVCVTLCQTGPCINGTCNGENSCACNIGWEGDFCDSPICEQLITCDKYGGTCVGPNKCQCAVGYSGYNCSIPICDDPGPCDNGFCIRPNECLCHSGYSGLTCAIPPCNATAEQLSYCNRTAVNNTNTHLCNETFLQHCQNGGVCISPEVCNCTAFQWQGTYCEEPYCDPTCNTFGTCTAPGVCECDIGYQGVNCETKIEDEASFMERFGTLVLIMIAVFLFFIGLCIAYIIRIRIDRKHVQKYKYQTEGEVNAPLRVKGQRLGEEESKILSELESDDAIYESYSDDDDIGYSESPDSHDNLLD